jgi:ABC-type lipoprotein export system ATPase subunit
MISIQDLKFTYPGGNTIVFPDIFCQSKDILLVLGTSGVGKTTLLHLVGGILKSQEGIININHVNITTLTDRKLDQFRGQNIGIVFQQNHFIESLTVIENVLVAQKFSGNTVNKSMANELLNRLNIGHKINKSTKDLSQGEKQRVAIARALINQPKVILADEPTSALDDINCKEVIDLLQEQAKAVGSALIVVTHDNRLKDNISNQVLL